MIIVDLPKIKVMYVKSDSGIKGARKAFDIIELKLPSLKGRKFYGIIFGAPPNEEYLASVAVNKEDEPEIMGIDTHEIPEGRYAQEKIKNWNKNPDLIGSTFLSLIKENQIDTSRPCIEFYRSMDELLCRVPVK